MKSSYQDISLKKFQFIFRFKEFMSEYGRRPTVQEIRTDNLFTGYTYNWVQKWIGQLTTIENRINKGIY